MKEEVNYTDINVEVLGYTINAYSYDGVYYLFIPNKVDISNLLINCTFDIKSTSVGEIDTLAKTITNNFNLNNEIVVTAKDNTTYQIKVMQSDIPSICINLDDVELNEVNNGTKDEKYSAKLQVIGASEDKYNITDKTIELKGRGNSTWLYPKKPYQIKFDEKENLLGLNEESKKWILLANHRDRTLIKNQLTFDLQKEMGLSDSVNGMFVDLYINGEFLGNYTLCDKIEIEESRVNLTDKKGVIVEIDRAYGTVEDYFFMSKISELIFVVKETVAEEGSKEHTQAICALYAEECDWSEIEKIIDVESFVKYYFLAELAEDQDRFNSSTFLYKDGDDDVIHIGPIWDSDLSFNTDFDEKVDYTLNKEIYAGSKRKNWYYQLYRNKEFVELLNETYQKEIKSVYSKIENKIDSYVSSMSKSIEMNFIRWNKDNILVEGLPNLDVESLTYKEEVDELKNWIQSRILYLNQRYSTVN